MAEKDRRLSTSDIAGVGREERRAEAPPIERKAPANTGSAVEETAAPLFGVSEADGFRSRWDAVQTGFVDEPRRAVEEADALVADVMKQLADGFARERSALEQQWDRGDKISTEDLRLALRRYRSFFQRLLSV